MDGISHYQLSLDPEAAARLEAGLDLLSAPAPTIAGPDQRSAGQRRADALLHLVCRAITAGNGVPAQRKAQLIVTIPFADLRNGIRGCGLSLGRTDTAVLDPETVRKIGCDADILFATLGARGQPLALGRKRRLVTNSQLKVLWLRDDGCTYPACHAPPAWSDAHHIRHWIDGGRTDIDNLTLLCGRHHTTVRQLGAGANLTHECVFVGTCDATTGLWLATRRGARESPVPHCIWSVLGSTRAWASPTAPPGQVRAGCADSDRTGV